MGWPTWVLYYRGSKVLGQEVSSYEKGKGIDTSEGVIVTHPKGMSHLNHVLSRGSL